jgi:hypothetical protein
LGKNRILPQPKNSIYLKKNLVEDLNQKKLSISLKSCRHFAHNLIFLDQTAKTVAQGRVHYGEKSFSGCLDEISMKINTFFLENTFPKQNRKSLKN